MPTATDADGREVVLLDTSTAVALVLQDHQAHASTLAVLRNRRLGLSGHAWFETFSVLTRLPVGLRRTPADVLRILESNFPASKFLGEAEAAALIGKLAPLRISGGAIYDALVGSAAKQHQLTLVSRDARAQSVYKALGLEVEVIP